MGRTLGITLLVVGCLMLSLALITPISIIASLATILWGTAELKKKDSKTPKISKATTSKNTTPSSPSPFYPSIL